MPLEEFIIAVFCCIESLLQEVVVYLHPADKYHRLTRPPS